MGLASRGPMIRALKSWAMPILCAACGEPCSDSAFLCEACEVGCLSATESCCPRCGEVYEPQTMRSSPHTCGACRIKPPNWVSARGTFVYGGPIRDAIVAWKNRPAPIIGGQLASAFRDSLRASTWFDPNEVDLIVPMGSSWRRVLWRGFNPASVLARAASHALDRPFRGGVLRPHDPHRQPKPQWRCDRDAVRGMRVLMVDDVMTTGETAKRATRALRNGGAERVWVATLARAVR